MRLKTENSELEFISVPLQSRGEKYENIFSQKNNKTLAQTLTHHRYAKLADAVRDSFSDSLNRPLGEFLLEVKLKENSFYKKFLNKYGDLSYSDFFIAEKEFLNKKGVYAYVLGDEILYIGRCRDSLKKRINDGYGRIHPKNCYLDGQATNCHLNARIVSTEQKVSFWLHVMENDQEIEALERLLLAEYTPPWNIQL